MRLDAMESGETLWIAAVVFSAATSFLGNAHTLRLLLMKSVDSTNSFQHFIHLVSRASIHACVMSGFPVLLYSFKSLCLRCPARCVGLAEAVWYGIGGSREKEVHKFCIFSWDRWYCCGNGPLVGY